MECNKLIEISHGAWIIQKCNCSECEDRRKGTQEFYDRFDLVYQEYIDKAVLV